MGSTVSIYINESKDGSEDTRPPTPTPLPPPGHPNSFNFMQFLEILGKNMS